MRILLDENFPLALLRALSADCESVEHIITLGLRGTSDQEIRQSLLDESVLFLTNDEDFLFARSTDATIVVSRVRQSRRLVERVEVWRRAVLDLLAHPRHERRFELLDDGSLLAWEEGPEHTWRATRHAGPERAPRDE